MRRPKISLKKYFYFTLICALLLIFAFHLRERETWKSKGNQHIQPLTPHPMDQHQLLSRQNQNQMQHHNQHQNQMHHQNQHHNQNQRPIQRPNQNQHQYQHQNQHQNPYQNRHQNPNPNTIPNQKQIQTRHQHQNQIHTKIHIEQQLQQDLQQHLQQQLQPKLLHHSQYTHKDVNEDIENEGPDNGDAIGGVRGGDAIASPHRMAEQALLSDGAGAIAASGETAGYPSAHMGGGKQPRHQAFGGDSSDSQQKHEQLHKLQHDDTSAAVEEPTSLPWFFRNGEYYPKPAPVRRKRKGKKHHLHGDKLFPHQDPHSDRIVNQLMYVPHNYEQIRESGKLKTILLYNGLGPWGVKPGRDIFLRSKCPVDTCELSANRDRASTADMVLYKDHYIPTGMRRPGNSRQVSMLYYLECPYHTQNVKVPDAINWTSTYRRDSDIVAPYEKWQYYDTKMRQTEQERNYAANKTKKVAWFVSNCGARNGRLQFAHELQKYIDVDIYGACGNFKCSRSTADKCFEILDHDYKFYLAFENSNCKDYITEKFFVNALNRNILPIVMGARPEDYEVSAPHRSYIHVDEFASPKELAEYLQILDRDDELYNSYFKWKGTGEFINTYFWCRVCAALHDEATLRQAHWYPDVNDWWRGPGVCTNGSWRNFKARKDIISDD